MATHIEMYTCFRNKDDALDLMDGNYEQFNDDELEWLLEQIGAKPGDSVRIVLELMGDIEKISP